MKRKPSDGTKQLANDFDQLEVQMNNTSPSSPRQSSALWQMKRQLECPICYDRLASRVLPVCGHSYCEQCIANLLGKNNQFQCPTCRKVTRVQSANDLPVNYTARHIQDLLAAVEWCPRHQQSVAEQWCWQCATLACDLCVSSQCRDHEHESWADARASVKSRLKRARTAKVQQVGKLRSYMRQMQDKQLELMRQISTQADLWHMAVDQEKLRMLSQVERQSQQILRRVIKGDPQHLIAEASRQIKLLNEALQQDEDLATASTMTRDLEVTDVQTEVEGMPTLTANDPRWHSDILGTLKHQALQPPVDLSTISLTSKRARHHK